MAVKGRIVGHRLRSSHPAGRREPTLRPARWSGLVSSGRLLRTTIVAALIAVAAGVLYADADPQCPPAADASPTPATQPASDPAAPAAGTAALAAGTAAPVQSAGPPSRPPVPSGLVGLAVRLAEPAALAVVRPGARVDLLAADDGRRPRLIASNALVLDVLGTGPSDEGYFALYLALRPEQARAAVALPQDARFTILVR
ncbi:MAG TPA: flagellar biosynthesis protein FlgA [Micromonosporaceae bacterium]